MTLTITYAKNGWVLTEPADSPDRTDTVTVLEEDPTEVPGLALLWEIIDVLGLQGGRYDARRLWVGTQPGDKHHDLHPDPCAECECLCEPDRSTGDVA